MNAKTLIWALSLSLGILLSSAGIGAACVASHTTCTHIGGETMCVYTSTAAP